MRNLYLYLYLSLLLPLGLAAQSPVDKAVQIDSFLTRSARYQHFNGNVLIAARDKIVFQKSYGYRDLDKKEPLDNNSVFELASVSKQFAATGILLLVDAGKIKLSDTLRKFFPELPYAGITIGHMLTHTSGLPDYMEAMDPKWDHTKIAFNKDMIAFLAKEKPPLDFAPGTRCVYCNTAYALLASIIEKVSGQSYSVYMQEKIFAPLGMTRTRIYNTRRSKKDRIPDYAWGYVYNDSLKKYVIPDSLKAYDMVHYLDGIVGDGCVNSTTGDLLKWDRSLKEHRLLKEATARAMMTPHAMMDTATEYSYGYGVFVGRNEIGNYISHSGGWPGYATNLTRYPEEDLTIIILTNTESLGRRSGTLAYIMTGRPVVMPYEHKETAIDPGQLTSYAGKYLISAVPNDLPLELVVKDGKLYRRLNEKDIEWKAESPQKFYLSTDEDQQLEFVTGDPANQGWYIVGGMKKAIRKA